MGRGQRNATHHNLRTKSPPVKKSKRKETLENLGINFIPPSTPSEKKSSNESNPERFIFLGKFQKNYVQKSSQFFPQFFLNFLHFPKFSHIFSNFILQFYLIFSRFSNIFPNFFSNFPQKFTNFLPTLILSVQMVAEKAFDKAFQLEDNSESENQESNETTTLIESSNKKGNSGSTANASQRGPNGGGGTSNNSVLTAIEPLSLPSVVGSKPLFNNTEKTAGL